MRFAFSCFTSAAMHAMAFGVLWAWVFDIAPPVYTTDAGRAAIFLVVLPAEAQKQQEEETVEEVFEAVQVKIAEPPAAKELETVQPVEQALARRPPEIIATSAALRTIADDQETNDLPQPAARRENVSAEQPAAPQATKPTPRRPTESKVAAEASTEAPLVLVEENTGSKVDELPRQLPSNRPPNYPYDALLEGIHGRVLIMLTVDPSGSAQEVKLHKSSGHRSLDDAAVKAVRNWRFVPARRGGVSVEYEVIVPVRFSIVDN